MYNLVDNRTLIIINDLAEMLVSLWKGDICNLSLFNIKVISSVGHNKQSEDVVLDPGNLLFSVHTQHDYNARASVHSCIVPSIKHEVDKVWVINDIFTAASTVFLRKRVIAVWVY